jgi:hypothetical protein
MDQLAKTMESVQHLSLLHFRVRSQQLYCCNSYVLRSPLLLPLAICGAVSRWPFFFERTGTKQCLFHWYRGRKAVQGRKRAGRGAKKNYSHVKKVAKHLAPATIHSEASALILFTIEGIGDSRRSNTVVSLLPHLPTDKERHGTRAFAWHIRCRRDVNPPFNGRRVGPPIGGKKVSCAKPRGHKGPNATCVSAFGHKM